MNQVYLEKLIEQESINSKIELIKEHIAIAKKEAEFYSNLKSKSGIINESIKSKLVNEFYTGERSELKLKSSAEVRQELSSKEIPTWADEGVKNDTNLEEVAKHLENMDANVFEAGPNPYGYEIDTAVHVLNPDNQIAASGAKDRLWFYSDSRLWSTNATISLGWKYENANDGLDKIKEADPNAYEKIINAFKQEGITGNVIKIYNQSSQTTVKIVDEQVWGVIVPEGKVSREYAGLYNDANQTVNGSKLISFASIYAASSEEKKAEERKAAIPWLDKLQTALDWLGFLPVVGDAIDAINATIYFIRWQISGVSTYMWQALLSAIAIIPVIGSALKGVLQRLFKAIGSRGAKIFKWIFSGAKNAKQAEAPYKLLKQAGATQKQMGMFAKALSKAGEFLKKVIAAAKRFKINLGKKFSQVADTLYNQSRIYRKMAEGGQTVKRAVKQAVESLPGLGKAGKEYEKSSKWYNKISFDIFPRIKAAAWYPGKKFQTIASTLRGNYTRRLLKDFGEAGEHFASFNAKGMNRVRKNLSNLFQGKNNILGLGSGNVADAATKQFQKQHDTVLKFFSGEGKAVAPDAKQMKNFLEDLSAYNPKQAEEIVKRMNSTSVMKGKGVTNTKWSDYGTDGINQTFAALFNKSSAGSKNLPVVTLGSTFKRADLIYNEGEDVMERLGWAHEDPTLDQKQALVIPIAVRGIKEYMPGVYGTVKATTGVVAPFVKQSAEELPKTIGQMVGADTGQFYDYDPEAEAGGQYA